MSHYDKDVILHYADKKIIAKSDSMRVQYYSKIEIAGVRGSKEEKQRKSVGERLFHFGKCHIG